jgi:hypothetical protein
VEVPGEFWVEAQGQEDFWLQPLQRRLDFVTESCSVVDQEGAQEEACSVPNAYLLTGTGYRHDLWLVMKS